MTLEEIQNDIIEEFEVFEEWMDKYEYLIELGKDLKIINEKLKNPNNLISGCQSKVWLHADLIDGKIIFSADSDAIITKGIVALVIRVLSNRTPKEIMEADLYFINNIGLNENLSPTRANGLLAMLKQMRMYAIAYNAKMEK